jgi:hypothetical protein
MRALSCLLLIAVGVGAPALAGQQVTPPGPASRITARYELYAPDEATLARAILDVDYAAQAFLRYFGAESRPRSPSSSWALRPIFSALTSPRFAPAT